MTSSRKFGRLLQAGCLGLIGSLMAVGCGGSSSPTKTRDGGAVDGISGEVAPQGAVILTVSTASIEFGTVDVGAVSTPQTVVVSNIGTLTSGPLSVSIQGAGLSASGCMGQTLPP